MSSYDSSTHVPEAAQSIATAYLGPPFVGYCANFVLYGVLVSNFSAYLTSRNYRRDSRFNRVYIWIVVILDTLATGVNVFECWYHGVSQNRTSKSVLMTHPVDALTPMLVGMMGVVVESYLLVRASKLFRHQPLCRSVFLCSGGLLITIGWLASVGCGVANLGFTYNFSEQLLPFTYNMLAGIWLWLSAATDVVITCTLIVGMRRAIHGFNEDTDNAIRRIMRQAMLTASWTALFGVCGAVLSVVFPPSDNKTLDCLFAFTIPLASLYALSLLTTLSSRKPIRRTMGLATPKVSQVSPVETAASTMVGSHTLIHTPAAKKKSLLEVGPIHWGLDKLRSQSASRTSGSHRRSSSRGSVSSLKTGITVTREVQSEVDIDRSALSPMERGRRARFERERDSSRERWFDERESKERGDSPSGKGVLDEEFSVEED